eukprot:jgi/Chrzof1/1621/Cz10g14260.t1
MASGHATQDGNKGVSSKLMSLKFMQRGSPKPNTSSTGHPPAQHKQPPAAAAPVQPGLNSTPDVATTAQAPPNAADVPAHATSAAAGKPAFSSKLLAMKFMQRGAQKRKLEDMYDEQEDKKAEVWCAMACRDAAMCTMHHAFIAVQ